jgi:phage terminase large subunit-like protein
MNVVDAYARAVMAGTVPAGRYHRLSCARHLRDRAREGTDGFPYRFDIDKAERFFRFAERLKHYKGEWSGQFIRLQPHQQFRLGSVFGWVHVETGLRRIRTAYNEIPRKNGKSLEAAIVALYVTFFDGEPGAEGICIATKREQSKIVFNDCKRLVKRSGLKSRISGSEHKHGALHREDTESKLEALGADSDSTDGLNPNLIINDEFHAQKDREMLDVVETATGARREPLNFQITTAGSDPVTPCGDQHDYACKILDQVQDDETFFAFIAHADIADKAAGTPEDDWLSEQTWRKANPNYGVSVKPDDLRALATKARHMPAAAAAFKQKRLNLWVNAIAPWLSIEGWRKGQSQWTWQDMRGQPCWIGVDMSSKIDLTAVVLVFPPTDDRKSWRLLVWCLTPEDTLEDRTHRDRAPYQKCLKPALSLTAADSGLRTNPGNRIDQDLVREWLDIADQLFDVQQVGIDPWNAGNLIKNLTDEGFEAIEIPQTLQQMSAPAKDFEADVLDGLVDAGGNELMTWCISNVVVQRDGKDNIYPVKKKSRGRIDPVIAALLARKLAAIDTTELPADDPVLVVA